MVTNQHAITIPANGVYNFISSGGRVFVVLTATAAFKVKTDNGGYVDVAVGRKIGSPDGGTIYRIYFKNTTGSDIDVTFYFGNDDYLPDVQLGSGTAVTVTGATVRNISTTPKGGGVLTLAPGVSASFPGTDGSKVRKQFAVTNKALPVNDPGGEDPITLEKVLEVLDASNNRMTTVYPQQCWTIETGGTLKVKNPAAAATIPYDVAEVFYDT